MYRLTLLLVLPLLAGCVVPTTITLEPGSCADLGGSDMARPDVLVQNGTGLHRLTHGGEGYVQVATHVRPGDPFGVQAVGDEVYAIWADHLFRFDEDLNVLGKRSGIFGGFDVSGDTLWVAHKGALVAYDRDLRPVETVGFDSGTEKVSHDVLVCDGHALLLDNVVSPVYVYQVDVRGDAARVLDERRLECLCHLAAHWIDADAGAWFVLESGGGMGHAYQAVQRFPLGGGPPEDTRTFSAGFDMNGSIGDGGHTWYLLAVAPTEPPVALGWHMDRYWIGGLVFDGEALLLDEPLDLDVPESRGLARGQLDVRGSLAVAMVGKELRVVDLGGTPRVLHAQTLDDPTHHLAIAG